MGDITIEQKVIYESVPHYCNNCKHLGHDIKGCKWIKQEAATSKTMNKEKNQATQNMEIQESNSNVPDSNGNRDLQNDKQVDDMNIPHHNLESKGTPLKPQNENKVLDNSPSSTYAIMDLITGNVSKDKRYRRNINSRSKKKDNTLMRSHSDEDKRDLILKDVEFQNGNGDGILSPLNQSPPIYPLDWYSK